MKRHRQATAIAIAIAIAIACLILATHCAIAEPENSVRLAVVRTWGDLLGQKPISLPQASSSPAQTRTYRLGIDATDAKLFGGVVLYCVVEGEGIRISDRDTIGPFLVQVRPPKAQASLPRIAQQFQAPQGTAGAAVLYMKTVPLSQPGDYTILVERPAADAKDGKFETVAETTVHVSSEPETLWSPWPLNASEGTVGLLARDDDPSYSVSGVANPATGVAIPKVPGWAPANIGSLPDPKIPLPCLFPSKPDAGMQLEVAGSLLIVNMDEGIQPEYPDEKFLTRWWVNGRPYLPKLAPPVYTSIYTMRHNGAWKAGSATEVCFQVEFHPEILGVKKGDTIGVQLLLCPGGWEYSGPEPELEAAMAEVMARSPTTDAEHIHIARLTNRVDFVYSGDPAGMAAETHTPR